ncbi:MAG: histidine kinase [Clostridia bacterium]|nr:histidine kinase [Clostridia bacterium]
MAVIELNITLDAISILVLIALLTTFFSEKKRREKSSLTFFLLISFAILLSLSDLFCWFFEGKEEYSFLVWLSNFGTFVFSYLVSVIFTHYLAGFLNPSREVIRLTLLGLDVSCALMILALIVTAPFELFFAIKDGCYVRGPLTALTHLYDATIIIINTIVITKTKQVEKRYKPVLLSYSFAPLAALILQSYFYQLSALTFTSVMLSILLIFLNIHINRGRLLLQKENEVHQAHTSLMLSQIQPHFMFNSLSIISSLCTKDAEEARIAVEDFAAYLRGNLDTLAVNTPVPFSQELKHVQHYLSLEKRRFPDIIIKYDIKTEDFRIPTLALQPLCENAIRHGLCKMEHGGELVIMSYEDPTFFNVVIKDNGVGFDFDKKAAGSPLHVGLDSIRLRIEKLSGGKLLVESIPGTGTKITIKIPKSSPALQQLQ